MATLGGGALGEVSSSPRSLRSICEAKPEYIRVNLSHTTEKEAEQVVSFVRTQFPDIRILFDLQGAKIRVSAKARAMEVKKGDKVIFIDEARFQAAQKQSLGYAGVLVPVAAPFPFATLQRAVCVRMKDATMEFQIEKNEAEDKGFIACMTVRGGMIRPEKGMNAPGITRPHGYLPPQDISDLKLALRLRPDAICVSFVTSAGDMEIAKQAADRSDYKPEWWAKIECQDGIDSLEEICPSADVILVGQGDLAGELGREAVHAVAVAIAQKVVACGKPCYVGTGVLKSLTKGTTPDPTELKKINEFLRIGVRGFLLTSETSIGHSPVAAIDAVRRLKAE